MRLNTLIDRSELNIKTHRDSSTGVGKKIIQIKKVKTLL